MDTTIRPQPQVKLRRPGEFEPHAKTWMAWPHRQDLYGTRLADMQRAYADVAKAIAQFEPVSMVAHPEHTKSARTLLGDGIEIVALPIDDCWIRDSGPTFLKRADGGLAGVSWRFNAWGRKHEPFDADDALAGRVLAYEEAEMFRSFLHCEGGSLACDGDGTLIVTETSLLHPNRNPGLSKAWVELELLRMLNVEKVVWLPGDPLDLETDGHVDGMCCFVRPGVVMFEYNPDPADLHGRILADNLATLKSQTDARGRSFEVIPIPEAYDVEAASEVFARSYINFALANGGVVMPTFGRPSGEEAKAAVAKAFPDRRIVTVDVGAVVPAGGAIHCITQEQPL
ncbi:MULTISPECIES: agmatine deiminase family protein [unclassified Shinella]|uniref:agmatine deiminase family protein n=1 Tax=unclassified Shinella TaxID=2643062 RepID=UPI00234EB144|nr:MULTISPECIES: agmatine deiminase family protein [unclassified Shinella]MCO5153110.1 agmatine deiminase family protein [Shinella sp.]MDC7263609.1 agmatine deiminase family protein [Shinella sp. HY16]MDC7270504.1 agmatine deiminase family protein [Shinella sp. YZ44]